MADNEKIETKQGEVVEGPAAKSCGLSVHEHLAQLVYAVGLLGGIGAGCPEAYHALVELAELARIGGGHERYEARPDGPGADAGRFLRRQYVQHLNTPATQPSEPDVRRSYDSLSPEQKRQLN